MRYMHHICHTPQAVDVDLSGSNKDQDANASDKLYLDRNPNPNFNRDRDRNRNLDVIDVSSADGGHTPASSPNKRRRPTLVDANDSSQIKVCAFVPSCLRVESANGRLLERRSRSHQTFDHI